MKRPAVVAIAGATGVICGVEMLRGLRELGVEVHLILSEAACTDLALETDVDVAEVRATAGA